MSGLGFMTGLCRRPLLDAGESFSFLKSRNGSFETVEDVFTFENRPCA